MTPLYIFIAGGVGAVLRWGVGRILSTYAPSFPLGTFLCNLLGCFLIGLCAGFFKSSSPLSLAIMVGLLGGFTTFSSFSLDALKLLQGGQWGIFSLYTFGSMALGIALCALGYSLTRLAA